MAVKSKPRSSNVVAQARAGRGAGRRSSGTRWEGTRSLLLFVLAFIAFRVVLVEAYRIPSASMVPTLLVGDWLFVNKLRYGPHVPFTNVNLPGYAEPRRGDVVVFESPYQADEAERGADPTPTLVKRLVGTPGDTLMMRGGLLYVNGLAQRQGFGVVGNDTGDPGAGDEANPLFDWQKPLGLRASRFGPAPAQPTHDNWGPLVVPPRRLFMMGDNRYNSKDSRYWGLVPRENVRGRPLFVYYSYDPDRGLDYFRAVTAIRWARVGEWIK